MKESEKLLTASKKEENDILSFVLRCKALREKRSEKFIEDWLPLFRERYNIIENNNKYTIHTQDFGTIDYFPKANKLLLRAENKWVKPGLKWLIENLGEGDEKRKRAVSFFYWWTTNKGKFRIPITAYEGYDKYLDYLKNNNGEEF